MLLQKSKSEKGQCSEKDINTKYIHCIYLKWLRDTLIIINILITQQPLTKSEFLMVDNEDTDEIDDDCGYLKRIHCTLNSTGYI